MMEFFRSTEREGVENDAATAEDELRSFHSIG